MKWIEWVGIKWQSMDNILYTQTYRHNTIFVKYSYIYIYLWSDMHRK